MTGVMVIQGRELPTEDIELIRGLLTEHPEWGRTRLSEELCRRWVPSGIHSPIASARIE